MTNFEKECQDHHNWTNLSAFSEVKEKELANED